MMRQGQFYDGNRIVEGQLFLRCIHEYLQECGVVAATLYGGHIQVVRRCRELNIAFTSEMVVTVEVSEFVAGTSQTLSGEYEPSEQIIQRIVVGDRSFDIRDPNSLQGIFEFVMSEENR